MAKSKSTSDRAMVWKAKSHAAYQGYSHLSGMEMTSLLSMWNHSGLRAFLLPDPTQGMRVMLSSQRSRSK